MSMGCKCVKNTKAQNEIVISNIKVSHKNVLKTLFVQS